MTDRARRAELHIRFANLRNGIVATASTRQLQGALENEHIWRARPPPATKTQRRTERFVYPPRGVSAREAAELGDQAVPYSGAGLRATLSSRVKRVGRTVVNQVARHLWDGGFRYYRTLGWGGEGVVALMYVLGADGQPRGKVVAKMALKEDETAFFGERPLSLRFRGQYHILQRYIGSDLAGGDAEVAAALDLALKQAETRLLLFEFAEYGSLASLMKRVMQPIRTPDDPLGFRATRVAAACQDMRASNPANPVVGRTGLPLPNTPVVHFDLEPQNMLLGGGEEPDVQAEHRLMPIVKVADFGLAAPMPPQAVNLGAPEYTENLWRWRSRAKNRWFLPEQFSQDWDYSESNPVAENINTYGQVAGHYGPASNVYHVGVTMWSCITGMWPQLPTSERLVANPVARVDGQSYWTYGADLLDDSNYGTVDRQIRETVVACLVEEPRLRIDSAGLLAWSADKIAELRQTPGNTDMDLQTWAMANLTAPPEPVVGTPMPNFDPDNPNNDQFEPFEPEWVL